MAKEDAEDKGRSLANYLTRLIVEAHEKKTKRASGDRYWPNSISYA
jgi:hypothetical protein